VDSRKCPVCGTESLVPAPSSPDGPRQVCRECERRQLSNEPSAARQVGIDVARLLIYAGLILAVLTLTVDHLSISGHAGFGWRQITGTELGILIIAIGVLAGHGLLGMAGLFLLVLSLGADMLNLGHAPGFGWRKQTALVVAVLLLTGGTVWQHRLKKGNAPRPEDENDGSP